MNRRVTMGAAAALAAVSIAACSSSGSSNSNSASSTSSGTATSSAAAGTDSPIKLLEISQLQASSFAFPEIASGAQAAADAINAAGGINGHKIQLDTCNDQGNPNVAATCGRTAVQGHYAAVINTVSIYSASFLPLLQAANIPAIGGAPLTGPDFTNPDNFPGTGGDPLDYGGAGYVAAKSGCKSAGVIVDTVAAAGGGAAALKTGFVAGGGPAVKTAVMAADSAPDFSAPVSQIVSSGVDCLLLSQTPQAVVKIVGAVRQSSKPAMRIYTIAAAFPQALASSLGKAANGVVVTESFAIPTAAGTPKFWADMTKYAPSAVKSSESLQAWTGVQIIKDVAASAKAYDNTSLLAAIKKASSVTVEGLPGTLNFTTPAGNPAYARIFAKHDFVYELRNGQFTPLFGGKPQDVSVVLSK